MRRRPFNAGVSHIGVPLLTKRLLVRWITNLNHHGRINRVAVKNLVGRLGQIRRDRLHHLGRNLLILRVANNCLDDKIADYQRNRHNQDDERDDQTREDGEGDLDPGIGAFALDFAGAGVDEEAVGLSLIRTAPYVAVLSA